MENSKPILLVRITSWAEKKKGNNYEKNLI